MPRGRYKVAHLRRLKALWDEKESLDRQRVRRSHRTAARPGHVGVGKMARQGRGHVAWHGRRNPKP